MNITYRQWSDLTCIVMSLMLLSPSLFGSDHLPIADFTTDTTPPVIVEQAQDMTIECGPGVLDAVVEWYDDRAGARATDNASQVEVLGIIDINEVVDILTNSQSLNCGNTGSVEVGFIAVDSCGNLSADTTFAVFSVADTSPPGVQQNPISTVIQCSATSSEILSSWLDSVGGARLLDSCDINSRFESFTWTDVLGSSGAGNFSSPPQIPIPEGVCDWSVSVDFLASDECGNEVTVNGTFFIIDTIPPQFEVIPNDTFFNCDDVPTAFNLVAIDECDGFITSISRDSSTQSLEPNSCEFFNYTLFRTYDAVDQCGNRSSFTQIIQVSDTLEPRFIAPRDTVLIGVGVADPEITGSPVNVVDNCNSEVEITFSDNVQNSFCQVEILRQWEIRDLCGLSLILPQRIILTDNQSPVIVREAENISLGCDSSILATRLFAEWVADMGNAQAEDDLGFISQQFAAVPGSYQLLSNHTFPHNEEYWKKQ